MKWYLMKTEKKAFDCVEMMDRAALRIYEETKDMTVEEEVKYWRLRREAASDDATVRQPTNP